MNAENQTPPPEPAEAQTVPELGPGDTGRWVVATQRARHILDLDRRTYRREPGPGSSPMLHDRRTVSFTRIELWPKVGSVQLVWFDDPDLPDSLEHWRQSSTIRSIRRLMTALEQEAQDDADWSD
jgi:hypothetical protein